jgi:N-acetylglucosaminyldiphosphoundecaprenol N-acetyl-beta-D-mannosaminyltransferase
LASLSPEEHEQMLARIRAAQPQLVFVAFGQPKGELWIADHYESLGPAVCVQIGASIDFAAGRVRRAPGWMQTTGLEWVYRFYQEPLRLGPRYAANARFVIGALAGAVASAIFKPFRPWLTEAS